MLVIKLFVEMKSKTFINSRKFHTHESTNNEKKKKKVVNYGYRLLLIKNKVKNTTK